MKKSDRLKLIENTIESTKKTLKFAEIYDIFNIIFSITMFVYSYLVLNNLFSVPGEFILQPELLPYFLVFPFPPLIIFPILAFINIKNSKIPGEFCFVKKKIVKNSCIFHAIEVICWNAVNSLIVFLLVGIMLMDNMSNIKIYIYVILLFTLCVSKIIFGIIIVSKLTNLKIYKIQDPVIEKNNF